MHDRVDAAALISRSSSTRSPTSPMTSSASGATAQSKPVERSSSTTTSLAAIDKLADHVAADIAGATGDEYAHDTVTPHLRPLNGPLNLG